jgi:hypothetical protein
MRTRITTIPISDVENHHAYIHQHRVYILKSTNVNQLSGITSIQKKEFRVWKPSLFSIFYFSILIQSRNLLAD